MLRDQQEAVDAAAARRAAAIEDVKALGLPPDAESIRALLAEAASAASAMSALQAWEVEQAQQAARDRAVKLRFGPCYSRLTQKWVRT